MKVDILNRSGENSGSSLDLPGEIYGIEPNEHCIYLAVKAYNAARHQGTHSAKERGDVAGSGRKIKRQKGTGTARAGDIKNPIFRGGGRVFGPRPRDYEVRLNKKVKNLARRSAFAGKAQTENIIIVDSLSFDQPRTKDFKQFLADLKVENKKVLVITKDNKQNTYLSSRNLQNVEIAHGININTYQVLNADKLIIEQAAVESINELLA